MSRSKKALLLLALAFAPLSTFAAGDLKNEVLASYKSFYPNVGGLDDLGARLRLDRFEFGVAKLQDSISAEAAWTYKMDIKSFFVPRLIAGVAYANKSFGPIGGMGLTFPILPIFNGAIGLSLDSYVYTSIHGKRVAVFPVIPLSLSYLF